MICVLFFNSQMSMPAQQVRKQCEFLTSCCYVIHVAQIPIMLMDNFKCIHLLTNIFSASLACMVQTSGTTNLLVAIYTNTATMHHLFIISEWFGPVKQR